MNKGKLLAAFLLAAFLDPAIQAASPVPPTITNFVVAQRLNNMLVDINYDLIDPDSTNIWMLVECSANGGTNYGVPMSVLSGDAGPVTPGNGKHIVWNAWIDWAGNFTTNARIRLTADDTASVILSGRPTNTPAPNLVWIPTGSFNMSGTLVYLSQNFWMGKYEVTQGEWIALMTNNPSAHTGNTNLPVENVNWFEATQYCQALTARERAAGRISSNQVYRLPTEAEWEYACRASSITTYYYGDDPGRLGAFAWINGNSSGTTQLAGSRIPNRWGLYDMLGNVAEWCSDWYGNYLPEGNVTDPQGPVSGSYRMVRGGAFGSPAIVTTCSFRFPPGTYLPASTPILESTSLAFALFCIRRNRDFRSCSVGDTDEVIDAQFGKQPVTPQIKAELCYLPRGMG